MTERLPDFLIIGAQKAGTTTLFRDLETHPQIAFSHHKEPHSLCHDDVLSPRGRKRYAAYFSHVQPGQICGEASTGYTRFPQFTGSAERALETLGPELRLLYIVRDPVDRAVSHHHHAWSDGRMPASVDEAVATDERLIAFGRYGMQLEQWLERFRREQLMIIVFEEYMGDRRGGAGAAQRFLGVDPRPELVDPDARHNAAEQRLRMPGPLRLMTESDYYSRVIRRWVPSSLRRAVARRVLPVAPPRPAPPSAETVNRILKETRADCHRIAELLGRSGSPWDEQETRDGWARRRAEVTPAPPDP
jgi:hypothetical protein